MMYGVCVCLCSDEFIGETTIHLEDRLFSKQWQNGRKPVERRGLLLSGHGRIPQVCVYVYVYVCMYVCVCM